MLTSQLAHIDLLHLVFNVSSIWSLRQVEEAPGALHFLHCSLLILLVTAAVRSAAPRACSRLPARLPSRLLPLQVYVAVLHCLVAVLQRERFRHVVVVGYSGVVFAWLTAMAMSAAWLWMAGWHAR